jgi:antitoxin ParD1/3/4
MSDMTTVTISMPESLKQFLDHEVETKGYGNVSEYMRTLLREARARDSDSRLQALLLEGLASGREVPLTPDFWRQLHVDAAKIAVTQKKRGKTRKRK